MTQALIRLQGTLWWVLVEVELEQIVAQYHRPRVEADIAAIETTLLQYPSMTTMEEDLAAIIWLVQNYDGATQERKDRVIAMVNDMWQSYQGDSQMLEAAQLRARLLDLQTLLAQMVV